MCYLMTTFWCPSDILITSWLFKAWWSTWPGNHLVPCVGCVPWVGRILHPDSCTSVSSWSKVPFYPSGLSLCLSVDHFCLVPVDDMVLFHGMVCDGHWWTVLLVTVSIVINSNYWGCVLFVKLAVHLLVAFVLFSLLFVVAVIWRIKIYN